MDASLTSRIINFVSGLAPADMEMPEADLLSAIAEGLHLRRITDATKDTSNNIKPEYLAPALEQFIQAQGAAKDAPAS